MAEQEEKYWLERLKESDETALRKIFDAYYAVLVSCAYRIISDEDTCHDIVQDVFVEFWNKRERIEIHTSLIAYLRRAVVNRALNHLKSSNRGVIDQTAELPETADVSDEFHVGSNRTEELEQLLFQAIERLPERCRAIFALSRFENLSHKEIAEQLGISVKTIENQITKAMKLLRSTLRDLS